MYSHELQVINDRLETLYGRHEERNLPRFRAVFSDNQLEKRFGTFQVYNGSIWLREDTCIKEVPKYSWLENQIVVERLEPNVHKEVYEGEFIYEILYAFPTGLPPKYEYIEIVVKKSLEILPVRTAEIPRSRKQMEDEHKEHLRKESARFLNAMDRTATQNALAMREGVTVPSNYNKEETKDAIDSSKHDTVID